MVKKAPLPEQDRRAAVLAREVEAAGGPAKFAKLHPQVDVTYVSQLMHGHRSFGEKAARNMERRCGWGEGFLDRNGLTLVASAPTPTEQLTEEQRALLTVWGRLTPKQKAEQLDQIQAAASRNIEIHEHLQALHIKGVVSDADVAKALPKRPDRKIVKLDK